MDTVLKRSSPRPLGPRFKQIRTRLDVGVKTNCSEGGQNRNPHPPQPLRIPFQAWGCSKEGATDGLKPSPPPRTMPYGQKQRKRRGYRISPQGTVPGTNGARSWDKPGPVLGTNWPVSAEFHGKIGILSRLSLGWAGVRPCQGGPNPVFLNPVFHGSSCIHCAALHGLTLARKLHDFPEL